MKKIKENNGTAIILMLVVVSVLFIFTSFLVRKVVINATMVEKSGKEQESYALTKQGILYAVDQLNTSEGYSPSYDPTDWPGDTDWHDYNLDNDITTGDTSGNDVRLKVEKNTPSGYITIESQDLPRKLVALQAVAKNHSPLLDYMRFINSDVEFASSQELGDSSNGAPFHINGNLVLAGTNIINLDSSRGDRFEVAGEIRPTTSSDTVTIHDTEGSLSDVTLDADDDNSDGYNCGFTRDDSGGLLACEKFDTAYDNVEKNNGRYFDGTHLPSSYDYSENPNNPQYVSGESTIFWPQINEERYESLADLLISASDCGNRGLAWNDWYPSDDEYAGSYASGDYWRQEEPTSSYNYTPPGVHLIFSGTQDLDPSTSATTERLMRVNDNSATDPPAEYETSASVSYSSFTSEDVIFCEKDVRVNGVLPRDLTIVSGGNIYIDSNIYTNGHSLALLAKENVLLNTTHRWAAGYEEDNWNDAVNLVGVTDANPSRAEVNEGEILRQVLNFGGESAPMVLTTNRITLRGCRYEVYENKTLNFTAEVKLKEGDWQSLTVNSIPIFPIDGPAGPDPDPITIVLETPSTPLSFSRIRLTATGSGIGEGPAGWIEVDAVEIPITDMDEIAIFAENGSWYVISGNGASENNDQQEPFTLNVAISEQNFEDMSKWDGTDPLLEEATWNDITYTYDSSLKSNPPPSLPPSVNLVSLKRK